MPILLHFLFICRMVILKTRQEVLDFLVSFRQKSQTIGFVPTMGALHKGHLSLIEEAKKDCAVVIASIFVNPTQFNDLNDLKNYPRHPEKDFLMLEQAGCDAVFAPEVEEMYSPDELELKKNKIEDKSWTEGKNIDFGVLEKVMEGASRPGHFNGVAQVVSKLFRIVQPNKAYFGQKDYQQLAIIRSMVKQLGMSIEIIGCPIVREKNGLAMSSRNERLSPEQRVAAGVISQTLFKIKSLKHSKTVDGLKKIAQEMIEQEPQVELEYFEIADAQTLQPVKTFSADTQVVTFIAAKVGSVRLIDNIEL